MNDRGLLELAAKAAGITSDSRTLEGGYWIPEGSELQRPWNPLTDDGDALRLAVKIGISISIPLPNKRADLVCFSDSSISAIEAHGDPYAATRRAIVLAAAEIGRATP